MNDSGRMQFERNELLGIIAVLTLGLTMLSAVLRLQLLVPVIVVTGFFIAMPLVALLGDSLSIVESDEGGETVRAATQTDPLEELRARYARGDIDEAEFERRLDRLVETEDLDVSGSRTADRSSASDRLRDRERERE